MNARRQHLLNHPRIGAYHILVRAVRRQRYNHRRGAVPAPRRTARGETTHELLKRGYVIHAVFHFIHEVVRPRTHSFNTALVTALLGGRVVERLPLFKQLDCTVNSCHISPRSFHKLRLSQKPTSG